MRRMLAVAVGLAVLAVTPAVAQAPPKYLNKQYSDTVHDLRACLDVLSPSERQIVVLRSGIGPDDPASPQQVASALNISVASVSKTQWAPVHKMRAAQKAGRCGATQAATTTTS